MSITTVMMVMKPDGSLEVLDRAFAQQQEQQDSDEIDLDARHLDGEWIEWKPTPGAACPVGKGTKGSVRFANGAGGETVARELEDYSWEGNYPDYVPAQIVAYKVTERGDEDPYVSWDVKRGDLGVPTEVSKIRLRNGMELRAVSPWREIPENPEAEVVAFVPRDEAKPEEITPPKDSWINWRATEDDVEPLPGDTQVEVQLRDGDVDEGDVEDFGWNESESTTIVRYRVKEDSDGNPGWIGWDCFSPRAKFPPRTGVFEVKLRNGMIQPPRASSSWRWTGLPSGEPHDGDIIAYRKVSVPASEGTSQPQESLGPFRWRATKKAVCPLPPDTRIQVRTRQIQEAGKWSSPGKAISFTWASRTRKSYDVREYRVLGPIPEGWQPHEPNKDGRRPCGMGVLVEIRTRDGSHGVLHAHKVNWKRMFRKRDSEVVAWRKANR